MELNGLIALFFTVGAGLNLLIYTFIGYILTSMDVLCIKVSLEFLALHIITCYINKICRTTMFPSHGVAL